MCHKLTRAVQQTRSTRCNDLFDNFVGAREHGWPQLDAERPGGFEVDD
jgi:hypothetical protein